MTTTRPFARHDMVRLVAETAKTLNPRAWPHMTELEQAKELERITRILDAAWAVMGYSGVVITQEVV